MNRLGILLALLGLVAGCGSNDGGTPPTPDEATETPDAAAVKKFMSPAQPTLGDPMTNSLGMVLVPIPAGEFMMGDEEKHPVKISKSFQLGAYEVTQGQYEKVMGKNPSRLKGLSNPVTRVSREDAAEFCRRLSALPAEKAAGHVYRLPTEAEWEYACRAGTTTAYSFGDDPTKLGEYAWYKANAASRTHPVGEKKPNPWGLFDMHGNVSEWCHDWFGDYPSGSVTDPTGPESGSYRVYRGGCWFHFAKYCESSLRLSHSPSIRYDDLGFRVAAVPSS